MKTSEERRPLSGGLLKIITAWTSEVERDREIRKIMSTEPRFVSADKRTYSPRRHVIRYVAEIVIKNEV